MRSQRRYGLVACVSGRRALDARRIVGHRLARLRRQSRARAAGAGRERSRRSIRGAARRGRARRRFAARRCRRRAARARRRARGQGRDLVLPLARRADEPAAAQAALERVAADARRSRPGPALGPQGAGDPAADRVRQGSRMAALLRAPGLTGRCSAVTTRPTSTPFARCAICSGAGGSVHAVRVGRALAGGSSRDRHARPTSSSTGPRASSDLLERLALTA